MIGLTRVLYLSSLMLLWHFIKLRWRNAREPLAFLTALSMCFLQVNFGYGDTQILSAFRNS